MGRAAVGADRAVVVGASMAGLFAARVLADRFGEVIVVDRDALPDGPEVRRGVPQAPHAHLLLNRGVGIAERLFPSLFGELEAAGAVAVDAGRDARWFQWGGWKQRYPSGIYVCFATRALVEWKIRTLLGAHPNVRFVTGCAVRGLAEEAGRVRGVLLEEGSAAGDRLDADLVIDASGRGTRTPRWLAELGYPAPPIEEIEVDLGYASRFYRRPVGFKLPLVVNSLPPGKRSAYVFPVERDRMLVTLAGMLGDHPPNDDAGFLAFADSLPQPDVHDALMQSEPLGPIEVYKFRASTRRRYERMGAFPDGLVVLGDAACSFNPVFGQGMTTAAIEAEVLATSLRGTGYRAEGFSARFQRRIAKVIDDPWLLVASEDFRHAETRGRRPSGLSVLQWYTGRVFGATTRDPAVTHAFYEVLHMRKGPMALFAPGILVRVLAGARAAAPAPAAAETPIG